jgi:hypothetical protein
MVELLSHGEQCSILNFLVFYTESIDQVCAAKESGEGIHQSGVFPFLAHHTQKLDRSPNEAYSWLALHITDQHGASRPGGSDGDYKGGTNPVAFAFEVDLRQEGLTNLIGSLFPVPFGPLCRGVRPPAARLTRISQ